MRLRRFVLTTIVLLAGTAVTAAASPGTPTPGAPGAGDPYFPLAGNGGYDVSHYRLAIEYDPDTDRLEGVAWIRARATKDLSRFNLDLDGLTVRSIKVAGRTATWTRNAGELKVTPALPLRRHQSFLTVVRYGGVPIQLPYGPGVIPTDDGALVLGEPEGASSWFPVNDHPTDKASYTISTTVPRGLQAIGNGALQSVRTNGGRSTWTWNAREPMAPYLATVSIGEFLVERYKKNGLRYWDAIDPDLFRATGSEPHTGSRYAWSQQTGDGPSYKRLSRTINVPNAGATLSFWVDRSTEVDWDFFFVEARRTGTGAWTTLRDENGNNSQWTGFSCPWWHADHPFLAHYQTPQGDDPCEAVGTTGKWWAATGNSGGWEQWRMDLSPYAGSAVRISLAYASDFTVQDDGVFVDDIVLSTGEGSTSFEADGNPLDGWRVSGPPPGSSPNENDWIATRAVDLTSLGEEIRASFDRQPEIIRFLERHFGDYPFATAGGVVDDTDAGFALENQTRPVYSPVFWEFGFGDFVVVHEIAHQWYGDHVAVARWQDIWLNEGFASYAEWMWSEREGFESAQETFDFLYNDIPVDDEFWDLRIGDPGPDHLFDDPVYTRGAMTLQVLRNTIGDRAFFRLLRSWAAGDGNRTTAAFIARAERISGQQLDALFDAWLYTPGRPEIGSVAAGGSVTATSAAVAERVPMAVKSLLARAAAGGAKQR